MISVPEATTLPSVAPADAALERLDDRRRKAIRKRRERSIEDDPHHLPVTGDRILPCRRLRHSTVRPATIPAVYATEIDDAPETERTEIRNAKRNLPWRCCRECCCPDRRRPTRPVIRRNRRCRARSERHEEKESGERCLDRRDGVLERHVIPAVDVEDDDELVEVLDPGLEVPSVHEVNRHYAPVAPRGIEEYVLDVGLSRGRGRDSVTWDIRERLLACTDPGLQARRVHAARSPGARPAPRTR